jgi:hypothetical protein
MVVPETDSKVWGYGIRVLKILEYRRLIEVKGQHEKDPETGLY